MESTRKYETTIYLQPAVAQGSSPESSGSSKMMSSANGSLADFNKKASAASIINKINNYASSEKQTIKSSSSVVSSSSSSKKAVLHHAMSTEQAQQQNELFQENRNFSRSVSVTSNDARLKMASSASALVSGGLVQRALSTSSEQAGEADLHHHQEEQQQLQFEQQQRVSSSSKVKVSSSEGGYTAEEVAVASNQERKLVQAGGLSFEEKSASSALKQKLEAEGFSAEKVSAVRQDQLQVRSGESLVQQQQRTSAAHSSRLTSGEFTAEKVAVAQEEQRRSFAQGLVMQAEKNVSSSAKMTFTAKGVSSSKSSSCHQSSVDFGGATTPGLGGFEASVLQGLDDDLRLLGLESSPESEVDRARQRMVQRMTWCVDRLTQASPEESLSLLPLATDLVRRAWAIPGRGHDVGAALCDALRERGGLRTLVDLCAEGVDRELQLRGAQLLQQCLASAECRRFVVERGGLERVVRSACALGGCAGAGILEKLFEHSEAACSDVIRAGGLEALLDECRRTRDVETLLHCATALANLSLYGGPENQEAMIKRKVHVWLFHLAFNADESIQYYACLAISSLVANKEIEAEVLSSDTLDLVEAFVSSHAPADFAESHAHGQSRDWLLRLVQVLDSKREEARSLAAFHFAMEAGIKRRQGNTQVFLETGAVEALRRVASSPNAIASKYAAQALQLIGEQLPHKLSQQVPLWTEVDVKEWVKQIGFDAYTSEFLNSRVDGDLLLQLTEDTLKDDIGIKNGILRKRFLRELSQLKRMADYTSCDSTYLNHVLQGLGPEFSQYTYQMLRCGIQKETLRFIGEEHLSRDCGIDNSIHRLRIAHAIKGLANANEENEEEEDNQKSLDVFVSYRRSNGSQLASLLKVHLQLRGFSVFIDVERLEAGKFDNNLLNSIRQAKHFLLVLTPNALDRCINDPERKDWVHKEIMEALSSQCNIIPILDNFQWPEPETLPEDMRAICYFNGVRWIHDYQDACVDKIERFLRGEMNVRSDLGRLVSIGAGTPGTGNRPNPLYQRSPSNDSNKGSTCSDKETNGQNQTTELPHY